MTYRANTMALDWEDLQTLESKCMAKHLTSPQNLSYL